MPTKETRVAVNKFLKSQKLLDMNLTLSDLADRIGDDIDPLAGYTFAWDKYVYDVALVDQVRSGEMSSSLKASVMDRRVKVTSLLNMNTKINDLIKLTVDSGIDEVAGYVYTEDKYTFIVGSVEEFGQIER
jgi:hypothetical protein